MAITERSLNTIFKNKKNKTKTILDSLYDSVMDSYGLIQFIAILKGELHHLNFSGSRLFTVISDTLKTKSFPDIVFHLFNIIQHYI